MIPTKFHIEQLSLLVFLIKLTIDQKTLKQSCPTRWNLLYYSLESFLSLRMEIMNYIDENKDELPHAFTLFTEEESWKLLNDIKNLCVSQKFK